MSVETRVNRLIRDYALPRQFVVDHGLANDRLARIGGYLYRAARGESTEAFRVRVEVAARRLRERTIHIGPPEKK